MGRTQKAEESGVFLAASLCPVSWGQSVILAWGSGGVLAWKSSNLGTLPRRADRIAAGLAIEDVT